jgi:hypothetical protein
VNEGYHPNFDPKSGSIPILYPLYEYIVDDHQQQSMTKEEYDEEALVREVIAENPEKERGVRDEWAHQVGWHRKEDIFLGGQPPVHARQGPNKNSSFLRRIRKEGKQLLNQLHEESPMIGEENNLHEELEALEIGRSNKRTIDQADASEPAKEPNFSMSMIVVSLTGIIAIVFVLVIFMKNSRKRQKALRKRHYSF